MVDLDREIKYRYTCKRDNGHVFSQIFTLEQIEEGKVPEWMNLNFVGATELRRGQFTNRKDKYGTEIYEGDTVRFSIEEVEQANPEVVEWRGSGFEMLNQNCDPYFRIDLDSLEVIGNIHESPELTDYNTSS